MSELLEIREKLAAEKRDLQQNMAGLGISKNFAYKMRGTSDNPVWETRKVWVERLIAIDKEIHDINRALASSNKGMADKMQMAKNVIKEVFGFELMVEIFNEAENRLRGDHPMKISIPNQGIKKSYKNECIELADLIIKARKAINKYIEENEPEINKGTYLQSVSSLNKCLPSYSDLEKIKNKINF